jgi:mannuronan 5-epimerase
VASPFYAPFFQSAYYLGNVFGQEQFQRPESNSCITYDPQDKIITITCKSATLTDIGDQLKDPDILHRETYDNIWALNAAIIVDKGATLNIDSKDTKWLKIVAGGEEGDGKKDGAYKGQKGAANSISVLGGLIIDSVKITSWIPSMNDYMRYEVEIRQGSTSQKTTPYDTDPRPYIRIEKEADGSTAITNSEIAYLGYDCGGGCSGLSYYGGVGHILRNNEIHHNRFGYYSSGASNTILEGNHVHHNFMYGFDPHTGTHDMVIRNNTVHDHGAMGIICSLDCYNVIIEGNEVYNSTGSGIMFSKNMTNSVARNNYVHDESKCVFVSQSHRNEIYNNLVSDCNSGIRLFHDASENSIHNNTIANSTLGVNIEDVESGNKITSNTIINPVERAVDIEESGSNNGNIIRDNKIISFDKR